MGGLKLLINSGFSCWLIDRFADIYMLFNRITPVKTTQINAHVYAIKTGTVNFYIYEKDGNAICIDAGFGESVIKRELSFLNINPNSASHIFLTHTDFDHANGVGVFRNAKVYLSKNEEVMINRTNARKYGLVHNRLSCDDYELLEDNEIISVGAIKVKAIQTSGHTPGSISYLVDDTFLFTGDAFRIIDGKACPIRPILTMDTDDAAKSIHKLARIPGVRMVFTAHRGYSDNFYGIMKDYID